MTVVDELTRQFDDTELEHRHGYLSGSPEDLTFPGR